MVEPARFIVRTFAAAGAPAYHYRFSYVAESMRAKWKGAPHATEIPFVFDTVRARHGEDLAPADKAMAEATNAYWVSFAKTGDPNGPGRPAWPPCIGACDDVLDFANWRSESGTGSREGSAGPTAAAADKMPELVPRLAPHLDRQTSCGGAGHISEAAPGACTSAVAQVFSNRAFASRPRPSALAPEAPARGRAATSRSRETASSPRGMPARPRLGGQPRAGSCRAPDERAPSTPAARRSERILQPRGFAQVCDGRHDVAFRSRDVAGEHLARDRQDGPRRVELEPYRRTFASAAVARTCANAASASGRCPVPPAPVPARTATWRARAADPRPAPARRACRPSARTAP